MALLVGSASCKAAPVTGSANGTRDERFLSPVIEHCDVDVVVVLAGDDEQAHQRGRKVIAHHHCAVGLGAQDTLQATVNED
ncbi:hypothetical protein [Cupriavidus metallidurans]|uniref:hypothetical protein n=1 Tax=Cupriavidus metallidurans TaxID=119219 RepID=UPI000CE027AA|nr:hypothetical protein [Cupriavidus metallidurans]AVA33437.1 hypothetical protein C3Z06_07225 [Cupriavidus metallidurans]